MLDMQKLVMLRAIAATGSISGAARELRYTRSAVSQQVSALERTAGATLLVRDGRRISLTPLGRQLVDHTERILVELRAAEAVLSRDADAVAGLLRVGIPFRQGPAIMSSALTQVRERFPQLEIRLSSVTDETGADEVRRGRLDMVIASRFGAASGDGPAGLREWVLSHDALRLCVPAGHRLAGAVSCTMADLSDEPWVVSPTTALGRLTESLCLAAGFQPRIAATVDELGTALGLVGIGWGLTLAPDLTPIPQAGSVSRVGVTGVDIRRHSVLIIRDGEEGSPRLAPAITAVRAAADRAAADRAAADPVAHGLAALS